MVAGLSFKSFAVQIKNVARFSAKADAKSFFSEWKALIIAIAA